MVQPPVPGFARRRLFLRLLRSRRQCQGISLVELLIGVVISIVVLGATVQVLVSFIRSDTATQVELNRKDELGRILGLMQDEIRNAQRVESTANLSALSGCSSNITPQLILRGTTSNEDISYALRSTQSADSTTWRGPAVLMRCGLPYSSATGTLDTSSTRSEQVVTDTLCTTATSGCNNNNGFIALTAANNVTRNVALTLNSVASGQLLASSVQVPVNTNQLYGLASNTADGTCATSAGCQDANQGSIHYRPSLSNQTIAGSVSVEDIFYFPQNFSQYTLSGASGASCSITQCTVQLIGGNAVTITNGDVLVFRDRQIGL